MVGATMRWVREGGVGSGVGVDATGWVRKSGWAHSERLGHTTRLRELLKEDAPSQRGEEDVVGLQPKTQRQPAWKGPFPSPHANHATATCQALGRVLRFETD